MAEKTQIQRSKSQHPWRRQRRVHLQKMWELMGILCDFLETYSDNKTFSTIIRLRNVGSHILAYNLLLQEKNKGWSRICHDCLNSVIPLRLQQKYWRTCRSSVPVLLHHLLFVKFMYQFYCPSSISFPTPLLRSSPAPVVPAAIHCNHCNHCNIPSLNFYINGDRNAEIVASFKELVQPKRSRSLRYSMQNSQGWTQRSEGLGSGGTKKSQQLPGGQRSQLGSETDLGLIQQVLHISESLFFRLQISKAIHTYQNSEKNVLNTYQLLIAKSKVSHFPIFMTLVTCVLYNEPTKILDNSKRDFSKCQHL